MEPATENRIKILVVDDDSEFIEYIVRLFRRSVFSERYLIDTEQESVAARTRLTANHYDLCLLDQNLGSQTGLSLLAQAKRDGCRGAFIILTALEDEKISNDALTAGVDDYLVKDQVTPSMLDRSIRYALQRRQMERLITDQQFKLGHAVKMAALGELAANIAHEINTPLAVVRGSSFLARKYIGAESGPLNEATRNEVRQKLETIDRCTDRIAGIVGGLKRYSFSDTALPPEKVLVADMVESARSICSVRLKMMNIGYKLSGADAVPEAIECHENEVIQVLINLFNNACDALEGKSDAWIEIELSPLPNGVSLSFTDSGSGIPAELHAKVLQPYFTTKPRGKGTGLGLSICRTIVENHGGSFTIDASSPHTRFVFTLPYVFGGAKQAQRHLYTVMVVEDEPDIRELLCESFQSDRIRVLTAPNGADALRALIQTPVDLVVTDINMPELSGTQMIRELKMLENYQLPQVIFITGQPLSDIQFEDGPQAPHEVFSKPLDLQRLGQRVRSLASSATPERPTTV